MSTNVHFAQISDCHLYADQKALHYGANVFENLCQVLAEIKKQADIEFIVFTGDLTHDHSEQSYINFVKAFQIAEIMLPVYFLAGNHDEDELLTSFLTDSIFRHQQTIQLNHWNIELVKSKGNTPAGFVNAQECQRILGLNSCENSLIMMHHHPIDVNCFIDRHGLENKNEFWSSISKSVKAIACGHVHNAIDILPKDSNYPLPVYTCPATSIQFDKLADTVANSGLAAGYRVITLHDNGKLLTKAHFLKNNEKT